ncbi:MAG: cobalamin biosynthesis protein CobD [Lachnospiraceae bacterium]|nr:cobalamin biosynthesis protein CobD [Lachnospiraceae bacterium]
MILCHGIAFLSGFILDLIAGDPRSIPHPVRLFGRLIDILDKKLHVDGEDNYVNKRNLRNGAVLVVILLLVTAVAYCITLGFVYYVNKAAGVVAEALMTWQLLAVKSLKVESMKVFTALKEKGIEEARREVSMLVARDTAALDEQGVTKAAVETVAENTCDGVIAPLLFTAIGGPVLGAVYKAANTADSMIGYKNERYLFFGRAAARLDDVLNFLPARLTALFMLLSSRVLVLDAENAWRIYRRDARKTTSPNAGQTEAVCAGALGIALGGDTPYFGKLVHKAVIGDELRRIEPEDIKDANELMVCTAVICAMTAFLVMTIIAVAGIWI